MIGNLRRVPAAGGTLVLSLAALGAAVGVPSFAAAADNPAGATHIRSPAVADSQLVPGALPPWARSSGTGSSPGAKEPLAAAPQKPVTNPSPAKQTAPVGSAKTEPTAPPAAAESGSTVPPPAAQGDTALLRSPLAVVRWGFTAEARPDGSGGFTIVAKAGRPLQLWLTVTGGQRAVDQLRAAGQIAIEVRWERADKSGPGAPDLNTVLTIGRRDLTATFAEQVQKRGHFEWRLWSRKDALSPGQWIVSLTYPDGAPVQCGQAVPQPCRLMVSAG